ncbi:MAG: hypothetical protein IKI50_02170 [Clostridia bacterium]|nr:hypothetical protein [Clostridia bacterium]
MKKRALLFLLAWLAAAWTFSGCSFWIPTGPETPAFTLDETLLPQYRDRWCYSRLDAQQKENYSAVYQAVWQARDTLSTVSILSEGKDTVRAGVSVTLPHPLTDEERVSSLYNSFIRDNPQFFFIGNLYGYDGNQKLHQLKLTFTMDQQTRALAWQEMERATADFLKDLPAGDDFERELWIHDKLLLQCEYEQDVEVTGDVPAKYADAFSAYGALVGGRAVCEGYARAMLLLLQRAGIPGTLVVGSDKDGALHMWNFVTINGLNYHLDPTWDDADWGVQHIYFNLSTVQIELTHTMDPSMEWVDTCTAQKDEYYHRTGARINSFALEEIAGAAAAQLRLNKPVIELSFAPAGFANGRFFVQNREWFTETVDALLPDGMLRLWPYETLADTTHCVLILIPTEE